MDRHGSTGFRPVAVFSTLGFGRMDGFAFDQHRDVFLYPGHSGLGLFGDVDPVQDRETIGAIKRFEKALDRKSVV